jgi:hypothetical protein
VKEDAWEPLPQGIGFIRIAAAKSIECALAVDTSMMTVKMTSVRCAVHRRTWEPWTIHPIRRASASSADLMNLTGSVGFAAFHGLASFHFSFPFSGLGDSGAFNAFEVRQEFTVCPAANRCFA